MNKNRRQQLREWKNKATLWEEQGEALKSELGSICYDEEMYFDGMPENLQGSTNGMNSEEAIDKMNEAIECLDNAIECVNEAEECIEEII
jgi:hypothetical protein